MLIYNITIKVEWTIQKDWLQWMKETYIRSIINTGCFSHHQLLRLLEIDEDEGPTYALQLFAKNKDDYNHYIKQYLPHLQMVSKEKWGGNMLSFSTLMEWVE